VTRMRPILSTILELLGAASVAVAAWTLDPRLGLAVTGVVLVALGYLLERD
jgi:uncharacterized membrane protein